jgi:hypothetical protein
LHRQEDEFSRDHGGYQLIGGLNLFSILNFEYRNAVLSRGTQHCSKSATKCSNSKPKSPLTYTLKSSHFTSTSSLAQVERQCRTPGAALPLCGTAALNLTVKFWVNFHFPILPPQRSSSTSSIHFDQNHPSAHISLLIQALHPPQAIL